MRNQLGVKATEQHFSGTPDTNIGFAWTWAHPKKANTWVSVRVTDQMLCKLVGQPADAYQRLQEQLFDEHATHMLREAEEAQRRLEDASHEALYGYDRIIETWEQDHL